MKRDPIKEKVDSFKRQANKTGKILMKLPNNYQNRNKNQ